jgi:hypothetical protein
MKNRTEVHGGKRLSRSRLHPNAEDPRSNVDDPFYSVIDKELLTGYNECHSASAKVIHAYRLLRQPWE